MPEPTANARLGTRIVTHTLDLDHTTDLLDRHPIDSAHGQLAALIIETALNLDNIQETLVRTARSAAEDLTRTANGHSADLPSTNGLLQHTGPEIEALATRRGVTLQHLRRLVNAYRKALPAETSENAATLQHPRTNTPQRHGASRTTGSLSPAQVQALETIAQGGAILHEHSVRHGAYVHTGTDARISRATLDVLQTRKLVTSDTSTSLYTGQALSLTPTGHEALTRAQRANAARTRTPSPSPRGTADQPTTPPTGPTTPNPPRPPQPR